MAIRRKLWLMSEGDDGFVRGGDKRPLIRPWDMDPGTLVSVSFKSGVPHGNP